MYATVSKPLTFEEFLSWDDGSGRDFELLDGVPVPLSEPNANHEDLIERLCAYLETHCLEANLPYISRQFKQVRLKTEPDEKKSRKADIVIFAKEEWQQMKSNSSSAAAYIPPPGVIEVVSEMVRYAHANAPYRCCA